MKVSNMIKEVNESKTTTKHILFEYRCEFYGRKSNSKQKLNNDKYHCVCKKPIRRM